MIKKSFAADGVFCHSLFRLGTGYQPDTLVVTANRFEQPRSTVLAPTTVVTRQDIDRWQSTSVNDVLRRLPGVDITQTAVQVSSHLFLFAVQMPVMCWC